MVSQLLRQTLTPARAAAEHPFFLKNCYATCFFDRILSLKGSNEDLEWLILNVQKLQVCMWWRTGKESAVVLADVEDFIVLLLLLWRFVAPHKKPLIRIVRHGISAHCYMGKICILCALVAFHQVLQKLLCPVADYGCFIPILICRQQVKEVIAYGDFFNWASIISFLHDFDSVYLKGAVFLFDP